ncbi:Protein of unknown function [Cotesia congregata]|uniref:Uncharacterized protein n=1 Tax=Cotesia congregata TaxID=51543 RepID=A0A8J2MK44_COTCN|nr:Protein of unknown function [Cotesia congregata]
MWVQSGPNKSPGHQPPP